MTDIIKRLRIKAGMIQMGERIAWGSDTALMHEAADMIERMMARDEQYTPSDMADQGAQGWRDGYAWAKGEGCPEGYVMVPVDPTPEMLEAGEQGICHSKYVRKGMTINEYSYHRAGWQAMLAAAPPAPAALDVAGEPVAWLVRERLFCGDVTTDKDAADFCEQLTPGCTTPLFAARQKQETSHD